MITITSITGCQKTFFYIINPEIEAGSWIHAGW